eukprot:3865222-Rhodomonas_salina.1
MVVQMLALTLPYRESRVCAGLGLHLCLTLAADRAPAPGTTPGHASDPQVVGGVTSTALSGHTSPTLGPLLSHQHPCNDSMRAMPA